MQTPAHPETARRDPPARVMWAISEAPAPTPASGVTPAGRVPRVSKPVVPRAAIS